MKPIKNKLILTKNDYDLLSKYIYTRMNQFSADNKNAEQLYEELKMAKIYDNENQIPEDVIRVNSKVEVEEQSTKRVLKFKIVLPARANMQKQELSAFAPLSIAIFGYRKGQRISWQMPAGKKEFYIKNVINEALIV